MSDRPPPFTEAHRLFLDDPPANSKTAAAVEFGIDISLSLRNIFDKTPSERIARVEKAREIIEHLALHDVEYILIGGVALRARGSAYLTEDFDLAYSRKLENLSKLAEALAALHTRLRLPKNMQPIPYRLDARALRNGLNFTLATDFGDLDLLGHVPGFATYDDLQAHSEIIELFEKPVRVITLDGLLICKRTANRFKDQMAIPEIEHMIEMRDLGKGEV